jgi:hypothetical protein
MNFKIKIELSGNKLFQMRKVANYKVADPYEYYNFGLDYSLIQNYLNFFKYLISNYENLKQIILVINGFK